MFNGSLDYTICSADPDNYNRITCNLIAPITKYTSFIVTSLTVKTDNKIIYDGRDSEIDTKTYENLKTKIRKWYNDKAIKNRIDHLYNLSDNKQKILRVIQTNKQKTNDENNEPENDDGTGIDAGTEAEAGTRTTINFQIADIYPDFK